MTTVANQPVQETKTGLQGMLPNVISRLAAGLFSIPKGMAYAQLAGINTAVPDPDNSKASQSRDFLGEGLGNLAGSFFQSMATGGSLSRI
jgi:SulP family sulfate permease